MYYNEVDNSLNFVEREKEVVQFWKENNIFKKSVEQRKGAPYYTFYDGPPTANGRPHIGHVETRAIKDMIPRFQAMKGKYVPRKAGWDTHGLPVELEVEKKLGIDGKDQIENYGIEPFIKECKSSVWKYKEMWEEFSDAVGYFMDMDDPYVTYENDYIESEWWALKKIWEKNLLYKGHKIVPYCPRCGTPLSSHEVAQGYKDVKEKSAVVRFKVKDEDAYFLAWTTTPWTLPSNVGLCVNPEETYVKILNKAENITYYMAKELINSIFGEENEIEILEHYKGKELEYREYEPLFDYVKGLTQKKGYYIICDDYVTMGDGTGIVHTAPAFGEDDYRVCKRYDMPFLQLVDEKGEMTSQTPYANKFCKKADEDILKDLKERGLLFAAPKFEHSYPFCWRCNTPLIYYAKDTWFIKMTDVKDRLIKNNNTVNWVPQSVGKGRFGDWIENVQDWGISRNRYWGTPLNIWECECGQREAIGSLAELKEKSDDCPDDIELHKPYVDNVTIKCSKCGKKARRVPEVIDCWFDSGAMPFAQHHYPFENKEKFEKEYPASFISEAVDQTRGWFYSMMAISTLLFDSSSFENVVVMGLVLDETGQKMSKSKGNAVEPMEAIYSMGADAIRWYFYINSAPWLPKKFSKEAVTEGQRRFMGTLWNTYAFFVLYANIDNFNAKDYKLEPDKLLVIDKWLLSRLNSTIEEVDKNLSKYAIPEAAKALDRFVDEMSNWYVRRTRSRFWAKGMEQDKINAYMTLYTALVEICKAAAPMVPFVTEQIYRNLVCSTDKNAKMSVHLCDYPVADESLIDEELEQKMKIVLDVVVLGRACRNSANIKNRQPIAKMMIKADTALNEFYQSIIKDELNVKEIAMIDDAGAYTGYILKPQLRTLGPKYGKLLSEIRSYLSNINANDAVKTLNNGTLDFEVKGEKISLSIDDVIIENTKADGFETLSDNGITVVLSTTLTDELIEEGFVREIISKIQTMRKEADFEVMDNINVYVSGNEKIKNIIEKNKDEISSDVLAKDIIFESLDGYIKEWDINKETVTLAVKKIQEG